VLQTELLGSPPPAQRLESQPASTPPSSRILNFRSPPSTGKVYRRIDFGFTLDPQDSRFSTSPITPRTQLALQSPRKPPRYIAKVPFKVLDAPELADDFYLNLVDWGSQNILSVGLGSCVYLWNAGTSRVTKLCDMGPYDTITSVNWTHRVTLIALYDIFII
jgi:cell division cycle 20-like protein 1, cofactor of APC complex